MLFDKMREEVGSMMEAIHRHPFNQELAAGTLPEEKFIFYLEQDALYLTDFSRALALTGARLSHEGHAEQFMQFAQEALQAERELHRDYLNQYKMHRSKQLTMNPACFMYANYLLSTASLASVEEAAASVLPCFWVYREVSKKMLSHAQFENNLYAAWIKLYASESFDVSVDAAIGILNQLGEHASVLTKEKMKTAFVKATQLEWMFWDSVYHLKNWRIL